MASGWRTESTDPPPPKLQDAGDMTKSAKDSIDWFVALQEKGVRAHSWV